MSGELTVAEGNNVPVELGVADEVIKGLEGRLVGLSAATMAGYEEVKAGISEVRGFRTGVERSRKEMTRSSLDWRNKVNAEAKRITALLVSIEEPLKIEKQRVDDDAKRAREVRENAEREERLAAERVEREAAEKVERAQREKQEAEEKAKREEEQKRRDEEDARLKAEREALAEIRRKLDESAEELRLEREAVEAVKRATEEKANRDRQSNELAEQELKYEAEQLAQAEHDKVEAEVHAKELVKRNKRHMEEAACEAEERKPDREKLEDVSKLLRDIVFPDVKTDWAAGVLAGVSEKLNEAHETIERALNED